MKFFKNVNLIKISLTAVFLLFAVLCFYLDAVPSYGVQSEIRNQTDYASINRYIVKFKEEINQTRRIKLKKALRGQILKIFGTKKDFAVIELRNKVDLNVLRSRLKNIDGFEGIEEIKLRKLAYIPNDPERRFQWYLSNVNAFNSWDIEDGRSLSPVIAIIDSGADLTHKELKNQLWINVDEIPGNLIDDDKNGYIDDIYGVNLVGTKQLNESFHSEEYIEYGRKIAQTILGNNELITGISVKARKEKGINGFYVKIYEGLPNGGLNLLRSTFVYSSSIPLSYSEVYARFSTPVRLELNKHYTIIFETISNNEKYFFKDYGDDDFLRGEEWIYKNGAWWSYENYDLWFKLEGYFEPYDDNGHGTAVSGVAAAETNNNYLIAGSAPKSKIMVIKASNGEYLESSDIIEAILYAVNNGAHVINMSFAGPSGSNFEQDAINYAAEKGCLLVASVGNESTSERYYPAAYENVLGVSAYDRNEIITDFSNFGDYIDVSLPGEEILSIMPYSSSLSYYKGTSFSAPIASAAGALLISLQKEVIGKTAENLIKTFAVDLGNPGWDYFYGYGKIDFYTLLSNVRTPTITRFGGIDRHQTSVLLSRHFFSSAKAVVIARSDLFPDSLTASVLAASLSSPLLITPRDILNDAVKLEIERLSPETVYIIGGEGAISKNVENQLKNLPSVKNVIRIAGSDRYETAVKVAEKVASITGEIMKIVIATGENFPDALSVAPLAGYQGYPIILVKKDQVPLSVLNFLKTYRPQEALIIGGTGVVSDSVASFLSVNFETSVIRIGGVNRYETSAKLYDYALKEAGIFSGDLLFLATGENFPDALSAGASAGLNGIPIIIIRPSYYLDISTINAAAASSNLKRIYVAGGTGALPRFAVSRFFEAVKCGK